MNDDLFQLGERIVELAARINIATYEMLTLIAEFDRREGWAEDGSTSCAEWLAVTTGRMFGTARENVRVAHALAELPLTSAEMSSGKLSYAKVRAMTRVATPKTEKTLLKYARAGSAAVLMRAIEAASDALYREESPDARPRSRQRRADAAGLVAEQALAAGFGGESGTRAERYQVAVHTEMATLEKDGEPGRSEVDGVRVSAESSRRMACDAAVVPMTHRDGEVMGVGRKTRTVPPHIRRALEERDRGCRYPGCGSRFTEAHHVTHWADGGETSLANTVLLCRRHHRVVHEGRTRMSLNRLGQAVFFTKKGKMIASAPRMVRPGQPLLQPLPPPPPLPPGELYNGAARLVDSAIPWELEAAAREAVEEALDAVGKEARNAAEEPARVAADEPAREAAGDAPREAASKPAREAGGEPAREAGDKHGQDHLQTGPARDAAA